MSDSKQDINMSQIIFTNNLPTIKQLTMLLICEALKRSNNDFLRAAQLVGVSPEALSMIHDDISASEESSDPQRTDSP